MSVLIFYENQIESKKEYLEIRGLEGQVGITSTGSISTNNIIEKYFEIEGMYDKYALKYNENNEAQNILLPKYFEATINNVKFFFYTISPTCEALAYTCFDLDNNTLNDKKFITLNLTHNLKVITINLYEGIEYYLGSSKVSSIYINNSLVAPYHTKIMYQDELIISEIAGELKKESENLYTLNDISLEFV